MSVIPMVRSKKGVQEFLQRPLRALAVTNPDKIVQRRITRLKIFARPELGTIASEFENAIALTELGHKACEGMLSLSDPALPQFSPEAIWRMACRELQGQAEHLRSSDEMAALPLVMLNDALRERSEILEQLADAMTNKKNQDRSVLQVINELFEADETKLPTAKIQYQLLEATTHTVESRVFLAQASLFIGLLWRSMFYVLIIDEIGAGLEHEVTLKKLNEAIGEIPVQLLGAFGGAHLIHAAKTAFKLIQAFRDMDNGLVDLAEDIVTANTYITAYTAALVFWSSMFSQITKNATGALRDVRAMV